MEEMMKIAREYREVNKIKIDEENFLSQIICIKYSEEENMKKALHGMKVLEKMAEITTIDEI